MKGIMKKRTEKGGEGRGREGLDGKMEYRERGKKRKKM